MRSKHLVFILLLSSVGCGDDGATGADAPAASDGARADSAGDDAILRETFDGDGPAWPTPWARTGDGVALDDVQGGRARLIPQVSFYSLARMVAPAAERDIEATFTVEFADLATQGLGFYARQNGGYLDQTDPRGQGYAVFIEGFRARPGVGVWREIDGVEQELLVASDPVADMQSGVTYAVRFAVAQEEASAVTRLRCKLWLASEAEPAPWTIDITDDTPALQDLSGGFAVDAWSSINPDTPGAPTPSALFFDDLAIDRL